MKERVANTIAKAEDSLESAQILLNETRLAGAVNRAYYAMFDAFRALLFIENIFVKTHKGLQAKLHERYFSTGILTRQLSAILSKTEDLRVKADYEVDSQITEAEAHKAVQDAAYVIDEIKLYLKSIDLY